MSKNAFIITETRPLKNLVKVIENHRAHLPVNWELFVVGSTDNRSMVWDGCERVNFIDINYFSFLNSHCRLPSLSERAYNYLLTNLFFWGKFLAFNRVLIFQHDSKLLSAGIGRYLEFDFIGAPIKLCPGCFNGGLSLRNPKLMFDICKEFEYNMSSDGNEDIFFSKHVRAKSGRLPTLSEASMFSVETIFYPTPLGVHAPHKYLTQEQLKTLGV